MVHVETHCGHFPLLKAHLHGSNLRTLECQYLENAAQQFKITQSVVTVTLPHSYSIVLSTTDYIPDACGMASLRSDSTTSVQVRL